MKKKRTAIFAFFVLAAMALYAATGKVYVTPSGKKYHERTCRTLSRSRQISELTVEQAKARGYEPCKVCNP